VDSGEPAASTILQCVVANRLVPEGVRLMSLMSDIFQMTLSSEKAFMLSIIPNDIQMTIRTKNHHVTWSPETLYKPPLVSASLVIPQIHD
jgi:hypothetical protein